MQWGYEFQGNSEGHVEMFGRSEEMGETLEL